MIIWFGAECRVKDIVEVSLRMERKPLSAKGKVLMVLTPLVLGIFAVSTIMGKDRIAFLFSGYLKYFWILVLLGLGAFSARMR